jgi:hypothetical protein
MDEVEKSGNIFLDLKTLYTQNGVQVFIQFVSHTLFLVCSLKMNAAQMQRIFFTGSIKETI